MRRTTAPATRMVAKFIAAVSAIAVLVAPAAVTAQTATTGAPAAGAATVVKTERISPPARKVVRKRFRPSARPSKAKVRKIIRIESKRWGIAPSRLARRVHCESRYAWSAGNGQYRGLLQFGPNAFARGMRSIKTRGVKIVRKRTRVVRGTVVKHWSDGRVTREPGARKRQRVIKVYRGTIPRRPPITHGWAQLRIGAQSIAGRSAVSSGEWSCPA